MANGLNDRQMNNGVRILAFASRTINQSIDQSTSSLNKISNSFRHQQNDQATNQTIALLECDMIFEGIIGFTDELRHGVNQSINQSISQLKQAGIAVKMVTGDSMDTASAIAQSIGLIDRSSDRSVNQITEMKPPSLDESLNVMEDSVNRSGCLTVHQVQNTRVFCRQSPLDKLNLVRAHQLINRSTNQSSNQTNNQLVDQTVMACGDGLNDGPQLACADVGLAMGSNHVAKQAAGIVLLDLSNNQSDDQTNDQSFESIVLLIREGRRMMNNLITAIKFYLACKAALITLFLTCLLFAGYVPMQPVHVILLECFMDLGASVAFTTEKCESNIMNKPPSRWRASGLIAGYSFWLPIGGFAASLYVAVGGVFWMGHILAHQSINQSINQPITQNTENLVQTMTFVSWLIGHVLLAHSMRTFDHSLIVDALISRCKGRSVNQSDNQSHNQSIYMTLTSNIMLLVWTFASFTCVALCLYLAPLRDLLQLQSLDQKVGASSDFHVPAILLCVMWPLSLFGLGEIAKFIYSRTRKQ